MTIVRTLLILFACLLAGGCSSIVYTTSLDSAMCGAITVEGPVDCPRNRYKTFIGSRKDVQNFKDTDWPMAALFLVDTPFSAVLDVAFLIYTVPHDLLAGSD